MFYLALFDTNGAEIANSDYARKPVVLDDNGQNGAPLVFPAATQTWATVTEIKLMTALSGGSVYRSGVLTAAVALQTGDQLTIPAYHLTALADSGSSGGGTYTLEASVTIQAGQAVYLTADNRLGLAASAAMPQAECVGLCSIGAGAGFAAEYVTDTSLTLLDWTAATGHAELTAGAAYFLSATPGMVTTTPPSSGYLVRVGQAQSATTLDLEIDIYRL